jgi:hypothetical protein
MKTFFAKFWNNIASYFRGAALRRKRRKKEKEEDPFIYPIF